MRCVWLLIVILVHESAAKRNITTQLVMGFGRVLEVADISPTCNHSMGLYLENLMSQGEDRWALRMLDATSKIPAGLIYSYNFAELGDFPQCMATQSKDGSIKPKYCLGSFDLSVNNTASLKKNMDALINIQRQVQLRKTSSRITNLPDGNSNSIAAPTWAICLPSSCTDEDIVEIIAQVLEPKRLVCQTRADVMRPLTIKAIVALVIFGLCAIILIASTGYDLYCRHKECEPRSEIYKAFSVYTNGQKLFTINQNATELSCLNGIRVLSMMWVVVGHVFSIMTGVYPIFNYKDVLAWAESASSMTFVAGTMTVDTFFVIGGALVVYVFIKARRNGVTFNLFQYYLHRYLRLTPPLAAAVLVSATLLEYMGSGPNWGNVKLAFQENCENYWWSTLLYIQNYVKVTNFCVGQTWYLNMDMQLYFISPIILFLLLKHPTAGVGVVVSCVFLFIATPFYVAYSNELSGILTSFALKASKDVYMNTYYLKTHTRAAPWFIGVLLGYLLAKIKFRESNDGRFEMNRTVLTVVWTVCLAVILTCVYGGHSTLRGPEYNRLGNAFYIALVRPVWSLCVAWIIFACSTGHGGCINWFLSLPIYQVLNRFTYSLYLLHVTMLYMISFAAKRGVYFTLFQAAFWFWGIYLMATGLSIIWVLAFESPVIVLEKVIFRATDKLARRMRVGSSKKGGGPPP